MPMADLLSLSAFRSMRIQVVLVGAFGCGAMRGAPPSCVTTRSGLPLPVDVGDGDGARLSEFDGVEMRVFVTSAQAWRRCVDQIAQQAKFAGARWRIRRRR